MSILIEILSDEHRRLQQCFNELQRLGTSNEEWKDKLRQTRYLLTAHLTKEDERLYPALAKNPPGLSLSKDFESEMEKISTEALAFIDRYRDGGSGLDYAKQLGRIIGIINVRINREETILYREYEKIRGTC